MGFLKIIFKLASLFESRVIIPQFGADRVFCDSQLEFLLFSFSLGELTHVASPSLQET